MTSEARSIARYGRIYGIANIVARAAGIILIPVYAHWLTIEEYGVYTVLVAVIDICALVFGAGLSKAIGRFYFDHGEDSVGRQRVVSTAIVGFGIIIAAIALLSYPIAYAVVVTIFSDTTYAVVFSLGILAVGFTLLLEIASTYMLVRKEAKTIFVLSVVRFVVVLSFNVLFVIVLDWGVLGIVCALLASFGVLALGVSAFVLSRVGVHVEASLFRGLLAYGLPLVPSAFANSTIRLVERYYLTSAGGLGGVAVYGLADRLASLLQMFVATPFSQIFFVRRFESIAGGLDQEAFHRILLIFVGVIATGALCLSVYGAEIVSVIAPANFAPALKVIPLLALGHILSALNLNIELGLLYVKKTWVIPVIGLGSLGFSVPVVAFLTGHYGVVGTATAFVIVNVARLIATIAANAAIGTRQIRLDWIRAGIILGTATALGLIVSRTFATDITLENLAIKAAVLALFVAALGFTPLLDASTRRDVRSILKTS